jgi:histidine kinase-like protein
VTLDALTIRVRRYPDRDVTVIAAAGDLTMGLAADFWTVLGQQLAECPVGLVLDLREVTLVQPLALTVVQAALRLHRRCLPDVTAVVCLQQTRLTIPALRGAIGDEFTVASSLTEAVRLAAADRELRLRRSAELPWAAESPRWARGVVDDACTAWGLGSLVGTAQLVASELVANVYRHARTRARLELLYRSGILVIRVSDESPALPRPPGDGPPDPGSRDGRGLWLVSRCSTSWGCLQRPGGKTVWAAIRAT